MDRGSTATIATDTVANEQEDHGSRSPNDDHIQLQALWQMAQLYWFLVMLKVNKMM